MERYANSYYDFDGPALDIGALIDDAMRQPKPATALLHLMYVEKLPYSTVSREWKRVYGADANLQDAAEREAA